MPPRRQQTQPKRARGGRSTRSRQPQSHDGSGEVFNISDVDSGSDVSVNDPALPSRAAALVQMSLAPNPPANTSSEWDPDSDSDIAAKDDTGTAANIRYFFKDTKDKRVCRHWK